MTLRNLSTITAAWLLLAVIAFVALLFYFRGCLESQRSVAADLADLDRVKLDIAAAGPLSPLAQFNELALADSLQQHFSTPEQPTSIAPQVTVRPLRQLANSELRVAEAVVFLPQTSLASLHQRLKTLDAEYSVEAIEINAVPLERQNTPELWAVHVTLTTIRLSE